MKQLYIPVLIFLIFLSNVSLGQKTYLCLTNTASGKALLFEKGDYVYVGYDGYRNVMTNRPAIDGKSDTITDTLSVGMMDKSDNGCSVRQSVGKKRSRIDGWIRQTFIQ